jgi:hypothetical protein
MSPASLDTNAIASSATPYSKRGSVLAVKDGRRGRSTASVVSDRYKKVSDDASRPHNLESNKGNRDLEAEGLPGANRRPGLNNKV